MKKKWKKDKDNGGVVYRFALKGYPVSLILRIKKVSLGGFGLYESGNFVGIYAEKSDAKVDADKIVIHRLMEERSEMIAKMTAINSYPGLQDALRKKRSASPARSI